MPKSLEDVLSGLNYVFAFVFNVEAGIKLVALGKKYFSDNWNLFDLFVVFGTNAGIIISFALTSVDVSSTASIVRAFRIMRIFKLVKSVKSIQLIIDTVFQLLP